MDFPDLPDDAAAPMTESCLDDRAGVADCQARRLGARRNGPAGLRPHSHRLHDGRARGEHPLPAARDGYETRSTGGRCRLQRPESYIATGARRVRDGYPRPGPDSRIDPPDVLTPARWRPRVLSQGPAGSYSAAERIWPEEGRIARHRACSDAAHGYASGERSTAASRWSRRHRALTI